MKKLFSYLAMSISFSLNADVYPDLPNKYMQEKKVIALTKPKLLDKYCSISLDSNKVNSDELKYYQICLLNKELITASKYLPNDNDYKDFFLIKKNKQKLIVDHMVYQLLFNVEKTLDSKSAHILNFYINNLKKKAKLTTATLRPIDKIMIGMKPWDQGRWTGQKMLSLELNYPKQLGGTHSLDLRPLINVIGSNKSITFDTTAKGLVSKHLYISGYFKQLLSNGRLPASSNDYYTKTLNQINMEIFLIERILKKQEDIELKFKLRELLEKRTKLQSF
jgi:hypothetical protein